MGRLTQKCKRGDQRVTFRALRLAVPAPMLTTAPSRRKQTKLPSVPSKPEKPRARAHGGLISLAYLQ